MPARLLESGARPDRVIEPRFALHHVAAHAETPHPAAAGGKVPALRAVVEGAGAVFHAGARLGVERDRRQARAFTALTIGEIAAALDTVIVEAEVGAVGGADAVDHPDFEIRDEQLLVDAVIGDVAERRAAVRAAVERDLRKQPRCVAGRGVEPVDGARAARPPHAGHPAVAGAMQAEGRGRGQVDVGRIGVVERHAEDLADLARGHRLSLRLVDPMLAERRHARGAQVDDAADGAVGVDHRAAGAWPGPGKPRYKGFARLDRILGDCGRERQQGDGEKNGLGKGLASRPQGNAQRHGNPPSGAPPQ